MINLFVIFVSSYLSVDFILQVHSCFAKTVPIPVLSVVCQVVIDLKEFW